MGRWLKIATEAQDVAYTYAPRTEGRCVWCDIAAAARALYLEECIKDWL